MYTLRGKWGDSPSTRTNLCPGAARTKRQVRSSIYWPGLRSDCSQVARFAPLYDVPVADASADVRATFFNTEKYGVDDAPQYFEQVTVTLDIVSDAPDERVTQLVAHAERACHAAQSMRQPIPVTLEPHHNGAPLSVGD